MTKSTGKRPFIGRPRQDEWVRFWQYVEINDGCWYWRGSLSKGGYGNFKLAGAEGKQIKPHRKVYEDLVGPIPKGLHLDHLCRNPACVRPDHLEPVTCQTNILRGESWQARHAAKDRCIRGHEFVQRGNTRWRVCRLCVSAKQYILNAEKWPTERRIQSAIRKAAAAGIPFDPVPLRVKVQAQGRLSQAQVTGKENNHAIR